MSLEDRNHPGETRGVGIRPRVAGHFREYRKGQHKSSRLQCLVKKLRATTVFVRRKGNHCARSVATLSKPVQIDREFHLAAQSSITRMHSWDELGLGRAVRSYVRMEHDGTLDRRHPTDSVFDFETVSHRRPYRPPSNSARRERRTLSSNDSGTRMPVLVLGVVPEVKTRAALSSSFTASGMALLMACRLQWFLAAEMATKAFLRRKIGIL